MDIIIFRILFIVLSSAVLTAAGLKMFQMLQLSSYRARGVFAWFKSSKYDFCWRYFSLGFFSFAVMAVYSACFSVFPYAHYFGALAFFGFGALFVVLVQKQNQKTPLKFTKRVVRLTVVSFILNAGVITGLLFLGGLLPLDYYPFSAFAYWFVPLTALLAHMLLSPVEKLIQNGYKKKAAKILSNNPQLIKIGITGSFGKTTAKNILAAMLSKKYKVLATPESYNTPMGISKAVGGGIGDTEVFIAEMGARRAGDIAELCAMVRPRYGIITGTGNQHLETFGSLEALFKAKYELIEALPPDGCAFFNGDNAGAKEMFDCTKPEKILTGLAGEPSYSGMKTTGKGTIFTLRADGKEIEITTVLLGKHIPGMITLCAAAALKLGVRLEEIAAAAAELKPVPHRLELIDRGQTVVLDDAYNSNLEGAKNALDVLKSFDGVRIIVTPGLVELGAEEERANAELGKHIALCADYAVLNSSRGGFIRKGCLEAGMDEGKIFLTASLREAEEKLKEIEGAKKVILFENDLPDNLK